MTTFIHASPTEQLQMSR